MLQRDWREALLRTGSGDGRQQGPLAGVGGLIGRLRQWPDSPDIFHIGPQHFGNAPGLRDAANGAMGRVAFEDFGDVSEARFRERLGAAQLNRLRKN
ncbi:MAG TPA: hypothetical protein VEK84_03255 [Terriglobales bacterium]|nr:hypothetical protein [Terriglobales bacterium]